MKFKKLQAKLGRSVWNMFESAKDSTNNAVMTLVRENKLTVSDVNLLMSIIASTLDSTYHNSFNVLERSVESAVDEEMRDVSNQQQVVVGKSKKS